MLTLAQFISAEARMISNEEKPSDYYGEMFYLKNYKTSSKYYQILLAAVRETLRDHGTLMPFIAEDVFGRHPYLGGIHAVRGMTLTERSRFFAQNQTFLDDPEEDLEEPEWRDSIESDEPIVSMTPQDFFDLVSINFENEDALEFRLLQCLKDFLELAHRNGDVYLVSAGEIPGKPSGRIAGYALREGGLFEQPPIGELVHFRQKQKATEIPSPSC